MELDSSVKRDESTDTFNEYEYEYEYEYNRRSRAALFETRSSVCTQNSNTCVGISATTETPFDPKPK